MKLLSSNEMKQNTKLFWFGLIFIINVGLERLELDGLKYQTPQ